MLSNNPNKKVINFFIQKLLKKGKKYKSELLILKLFKKLQQKYKVTPNPILVSALKNIKPIIYFRTIKIRGSAYKVPYFLKKKEQEKIISVWFFTAIKNVKQSVITFLAKEIIEAFFKQGEILKKRNTIYKLANQSKVFVHYRWF